MYRSTPRLATLVGSLTARARAKGWSDAEWSRRAGIPKETLCRLKSRSTCDFATLASLASAVGTAVEIRDSRVGTSADGLWPDRVDRALETQVLRLVATGSTRLDDWRPFGPGFFLAGLAMTVASVAGFDRAKYLALAEALHPGASEPRVFAQWLVHTPLPPSRFLPMLRAEPTRAA
jgi:lambda repressor-like predicted transcriptional regulator